MNFIESLQKALPTYEATLPFAKKVVKFQPFKVKDAKNISIILQEDNKKLALSAMVDLLKANTIGINVLDLCLADAEFLFLQIRSKSVDEKLNLIFNNERISVFIPDIGYRNNIKSESIYISPEISIVVETPIIKDLLKLETLESIDLIKSSIKKVVTNGEIFYVNKFVTDEVKTLLDNLPMNILPKLEEFLKHQPELYIVLKTQSGDKEVSGFLSFFTYR